MLSPVVRANNAAFRRRRDRELQLVLGLSSTDRTSENVPHVVKALALEGSGQNELLSFASWMSEGGLGGGGAEWVVCARLGIGFRVGEVVSIGVQELATLQGNSWVGGTALQAFCGILHREAVDHGHRVALFDSMWCTLQGEREVRALLQGLLEQKSIAGWLKSARVILFPVQVKNHWYYLKYSGREITVVDSMFECGRSTHEQMAALLQAVVEEIEMAKGRRAPISMNLAENPTQQRQADGFSCGVFTAVWLADECNLQKPRIVKDLAMRRAEIAGSIIAGRNLM